MARFPISQKHAVLGRPWAVGCSPYVEIGEPDLPSQHFTQMQNFLQTGQLLVVIWNPAINSKMSFSWRSAQFRRDHRWCQDLLCSLSSAPALYFSTVLCHWFSCQQWTGFSPRMGFFCHALSFFSYLSINIHSGAMCGAHFVCLPHCADQVNWSLDLGNIPMSRASQAFPPAQRTGGSQHYLNL